MTTMRTATLALSFLAALGATLAAAQTPRPFPQPGVAGPTPPVEAPLASTGDGQAVAGGRDAGASTSVAPAAPALDMPLYPAAQYLTSYDAGQGQRYYLFGTTAPFADLVTYYRTQLRDRGTLVFEEPPTHMFDVGRFRSDSMAFPPSVTIKDWTFGGSQGYPNPVAGVDPARFPTIIIVVPPPVSAGP